MSSSERNVTSLRLVFASRARCSAPSGSALTSASRAASASCAGVQPRATALASTCRSTLEHRAGVASRVTVASTHRCAGVITPAFNAAQLSSNPALT
jgi:hypothetical protein